MFELTVAAYMDSAHFLRDYHGKCAGVHGHSWKVEATVSGERLNGQGLLIDFNDLKKIVQKAIGIFDHKLINDLEPFDKINPTSENLARYLFGEIKDNLALYREIKLARVLVSESRDTSAVYYEE